MIINFAFMAVRFRIDNRACPRNRRGYYEAASRRNMILFPCSVEGPLICDSIVTDPRPLTIDMVLAEYSVELEIVIADLMVQLDPYFRTVQAADKLPVSGLRADPLRVSDWGEMPLTGDGRGIGCYYCQPAANDGNAAGIVAGIGVRIFGNRRSLFAPEPQEGIEE